MLAIATCSLAAASMLGCSAALAQTKVEQTYKLQTADGPKGAKTQTTTSSGTITHRKAGGDQQEYLRSTGPAVPPKLGGSTTNSRSDGGGATVGRSK